MLKKTLKRYIYNNEKNTVFRVSIKIIFISDNYTITNDYKHLQSTVSK